jgi:HlyD family secretion protein
VTVDRGEVFQTTNATGVVESENEVLVLSPAASIVKNILKEPGNQVKAGEVILQLYTQPVEDEIEKLKDQLEMKKNNLEKTQLNSQSTKLDLDYNEEVKRLKIVSLKAQLNDQEQLLEVGGISPARVEETKQEITLAEKDLAMLVEKNSIRLKQLNAEEKGLLLQIRMDEKILEEKQFLLNKMSVRAPSSGIILDIAAHVGEKVPTDKMLVQMSDLSSFKLTGSVDEKYAGQIKTGSPVQVLLEGESLEGIIGSITPMVENNKVQFNVHLNESSHPKLIANQNVQIRIFSQKKDSTLRIKKLPDFESGKSYKVFVIEGDKAVKREITIGLAGDEYCEVLSGLKEGELVISEDTNSFRHLNEVAINN